MAGAARHNLLARLVTPGGDNPLLLRLVAPDSIVNGSPFGSVIRLAGSGGAGGYAYSIVTGSLPTGLSLNGSTGVISGTPSAVGLFSFVAQVQDSAASVYTASFSLRVTSSLSVYGKLPPNGEVDIAYVGQFRVTGNTGSVTFAVIDGNLPAGLSMDSAGLITGTPTEDSNGLGGTSYFTVRATDGGSGDTLDIPHSIVIYDKLQADFDARNGPTIVPIGVANMPSAIAGNTNTYPITISGGDPPYIVTTNVVLGDTLKVWFDRDLVAVRANATQIDAAGGFVVYTATVRDRLGATASMYFSQEIVPAFNTAIQPQIGGVDIGSPNPSTINFEDGTGTTAEVTNTGGVVTVKFNSTGGGGGGSVASVGGALPDSSGNVAVTSPDGSVGIGVDSAGSLALTAAGGGVGSIGGATPDSSGNVGIGSSDDSIVATVDSNGELDLRVNPETRAPMAGFGNGSIILSGTLTVEIPAMKYGGTITGWRIVGDTSGDVSIVVSHATFAAYNTMTTLFTAACSGQIKESDTGLNHPFAVGDVLRFSASGFAGFTRVSIVLDVA
jgi:hypothetical protein